MSHTQQQQQRQSSSSSSDLPLDRTFKHATSTQAYSIAYTTLGSHSSPPLVFIHGTPWSSIVWTPFARSLAHDFHVYLFDNPGFGASPLGEALPNVQLSEAEALDADLKAQSEVYAALVQHWANDVAEGWNGRKPHVVAHDHGGLMAMRGLLVHGLEYASLCLMDVVVIPSKDGKKKPFFELMSENRSVFEDERWSDGSGRLWEGLVEGYIRDAAHEVLDGHVLEKLKEPWTKRGVAGRRGFVRQMVGAARRDVGEVVGRYAEVCGGKDRMLPVRIIWGAEDRWLPVETAERLARSLGMDEKGVRESVRAIEGAGHLIMYDQPARLGVELGSWLNERENATFRS